MPAQARTIAGLLLLLTAVSTPLQSQAAPVVIELFTSQSCSSCPPADALLRELATEPDVLALDLHVDYWNNLGWHDPYSSAVFTERQQTYGAILPDHEVYTPELVVGGRTGVVGSDRNAVEAAMTDARSAPQIAITLRHEGAALVADAGLGAGTATLWLAGYDTRHETRIGGGENEGRTLVEANVVRSLAPVGKWSGARLRLMMAVPAGERAAVFLQAPDGRIVGAAKDVPF